MPVTVNVDTGYFATSKKSGLLRWPVSRSVSDQMDFMPILISAEPVILPPWTVSEPATFLNPPSWLPVTLEPLKPTVEPERMTYALPACVVAESEAPADVAAGLAGSAAEVLWTSAAGSEQPTRTQAANMDSRSKHFFIELII